MTVFEIVRSALLIGVGAKEKAREFVDDLVKRGEISNSQGAKLVRELTEKAEKGTEDLTRTFAELKQRSLEGLNIATKDDLDKLGKKVQLLAARVKKLEGGDDRAAD